MSDLMNDEDEEAGHPPSIGVFSIWSDSNLESRIFEKCGRRRVVSYESGRLAESTIADPERDLLIGVNHVKGAIEISVSLKKTVRMADGKPPKKITGKSMINWREAGTCLIDGRECRILEWKPDDYLIRHRFVDSETNNYRREITYNPDGSVMSTSDWIVEDHNPPDDLVFDPEWVPPE